MDDYIKGCRRGLRQILHTTHPEMGISNGALNLISLCLSGLNTKLVEQSKKERFPKKNTTGVMPVSVAQAATKKILPGNLRYFAQAAANSSVMRYNAGLLSYTPKIKTAKRSRSQGKITQKKTFPEFEKGVGCIAQTVHADISMSREAKNMVALVLQGMAKSLIEKSQQMAPGTERLTSTDIIKAVDTCMSENIAKHAISEGAKNQLFFANEFSSYKLKDFERLQRENGRMKKRMKRK